MIGRKISHYRIDDRLGAGGMGEVFLAYDLALGRRAALKVLPPSFRPELRLRLLREAETSRRLQHPGIATFFETGEDDGVAFIAMELVEGRTLRERLRAGPVATELALAIASGLLEALGHAHAAGVIHRDIKPENIMITGEHSAKLLDFGLARHLLSADEADDEITRTVQTAAGTLLGTIGYMPPEQLNGEAVDARTDIFAVGAVLYEMLSGRRAFPGTSATARIAATLSRDPDPLTDLPPVLGAIVLRALSREPERRQASAAELLRDLRTAGEGQVVAGLPETLAVIDFENRSGDADDAWIGSGIADSLATDLGRVAGLDVVPRMKVQKMLAGGGATDDSLAVGQRLGCRWLVSGSYQRMGPMLRVLMELSEVPTERLVTGEKLDGKVEEIFSMQDRLAEMAAGALPLGDLASAPTRVAPVLEAYECFNRGRRAWMTMTKGGFEEARELYEQAIEQEPDYTDALGGLAGLHAMRFTFTTDRAELQRAEAYARRAIAVDEDHADAHVWLAYVQWRLDTWDDALESIRRAGRLEPQNGYPPYFEACMLQQAGRSRETVALCQRAVDLLPGFGFAWVVLGSALMDRGEYRESEWSLQKAVELEGGAAHSTTGADAYVAECLRRQGRLEEARARCLAGLEAVERSDHMYRDSGRGVCLSALGRTALEQDDHEAARTAFVQCAMHIGGRPRTLGGGWLSCQALAGQAIVDGDQKLLDRALALFDRRCELNWSWLWLLNEETTRLDLARAAETFGRAVPW